MRQQTLIDIMEAISKSVDTGITFSDINTSFLSYEKLGTKAKALAHCMISEFCVKRGQPVIISFKDDKKFIITLWGLLYAGAVPVPLPPPKNDNISECIENERFLHVCKKINSIIITDTNLPDGCHTGLSVIEYERLATKDERHPIEIKDISMDDPAIIQFTSGSTGNPKGIILSHKNIITNADQLIKRIKLNASDKTFSWMPYYHDMGLMGFHFTPLIAGSNQVKMSVWSFVRDPIKWLQLIDRLGVTRSCATNFSLNLVNTRFSHLTNKPNIDLSKLKAVFIGAEPISIDIYNEFLLNVRPMKLKPEALHPVYGMAEATLAVTCKQLDHVASIDVNIDETEMNAPLRYLELGYPLNGIDIKICGESGEQVPDGMSGEIAIKGPNIFEKYYDKQDDDRLINDYFFTGDIGFIKHKCLYVIGRKKDTIINYGRNYYVSDLERLLYCKFKDYFNYVNIIGVNIGEGKDNVILFIHPVKSMRKKNISHALLDLRRWFNKAFGFPIMDIICVNYRKIPKTTSGKIMRFRLAQLYRQGKYQKYRMEVVL